MSGCQLLEIPRYDFARTCAVLVHDLFQFFLLLAGDVDLGPVGDQSLSYHQANAGATPGDDTGRSSLDFERLAIVFTVVRVVRLMKALRTVGNVPVKSRNIWHWFFVAGGLRTL